MFARRLHLPMLTASALALSVSCGGPSEPQLPAHLEFSQIELDLGTLHEGQVQIRNTGGQAVGPVELVATGIRDLGGSTVPGSYLVTDPAEIPTLNPGDARTLGVTLSLQGSLSPGEYDAAITAKANLEGNPQIAVRFTVLSDAEAAAATVDILSAPATARMGDVVALPVEARDAAGELLQGVSVRWTIEPAGAGLVGASGQFVAYEAGPITLTASVGVAADTVVMNVTSRGLTGSFTEVGRARESARFTSDLWLHGDVAYSGTWGGRQVGTEFNVGNTFNVWDIRDVSAPSKAFSMEIDARTVNDVKVRADGRLALITHEGSNDGFNGVTILDLTNPLEPTVTSRSVTELESGVHNAWIEGDYAYLVVDGVGNGLRILDISDPAAPVVVAEYWAGSSFLHDVYVRDGLAFLSHWNAGLVILDVGNGISGGSPAAPVEVSRLEDLGGQTHNAWYWPDAGYVFVGEEDFGSPGIMHVVDVRNLREPREVATYAVAGQTPHNLWLDEATGTMYVAWYGNGVRAIDVTGDLLGELDRQAREIVGIRYNPGPGTCNRSEGDTCSWAPQLHNGLVWVSDMSEGLIALQPPR